MCTLKNLQDAIDKSDERLIIENLQRLSNTDKDIELENNDIVQRLFALNNKQINKLLAGHLAEWCKSIKNRTVFTDKIIIDKLLTFLNEEDDLILDTIRALGNICYENEKATKIVNKNGVETIINILKCDDKRKSNKITLKASGFLVNLINNNEDLQKLALHSDILGVLESLFIKYIDSFNENVTLFTFLLAILNAVVDYVDEENILFKESLCLLILNVFKQSAIPEISVLCLEIIHSQSDKDEVKTILAKNGICELVIDLIYKYKDQVNDEESRSIMKMACDLIVIVLTADDCMNLLYNNGSGKVYENMIRWLHSDDADLLSTGILAIGNFARKDTNCIEMVKNEISKKLINLLSKYNKKDSDIKVQHALLSTLKNLVIPQQNKEIIIREGLIDVIYPMLEIEQFLVIFKLLGTLRMVIDGQEKTALDLLSRKDFLEKLVKWSNNCDHLGVKGEIPRLLAWMIKNCHTFKPFINVIHVKGCVKCLVEMVASNHAVMQNEAFYAISLLYVGCSKNESKDYIQSLNDQLIEAGIAGNLKFIISKYGEKMDKQSIDNLSTLMHHLLSTSNNSQRSINKHLKDSKLDDSFVILLKNAQVDKEKIKQIIVRLEN